MHHAVGDAFLTEFLDLRPTDPRYNPSVWEGVPVDLVSVSPREPRTKAFAWQARRDKATASHDFKSTLGHHSPVSVDGFRKGGPDIWVRPCSMFQFANCR